MLFLFILLTSLAKAQDIDVLYYSFGITLSDDKDAIVGMTAINFVHRTNEKTIKFDLTAQNKEGKGMKVLVASLATGSILKTAQDEQHLFITLPYAKKGDTQTIAISYFGIPDDGLIISKNKYGDRTFFADNWPNRAHHWLPCIDLPEDKASFSFNVIAPPHYQVVSNGRKTGEHLLAKNMKATDWEEDIPSPTKVMVIGVARFATKVYDDSPKDIPVSAWVYPQDSTKGFYDYAVATDILQFFSDYIGPYPYNKLANVQSKTIFGGMENASCIFYAESTVTGDRSSEDILAHEIAHQWFGDMATEKSFAHLWLSEGFATYFTDIYFEHKYGRDAFLKRIKKERSEVLAFAKASAHPVVDTTSDLMSLLNANSYQKGAWVLHMLRNEVGDSTFHEIIRAYYNAYKGGNAETRDFEAVAEKVSGKDMKWFFDQWLYTQGVPQLDFSVRKTKDKSYLVVTQKQPIQFHLSLNLTFSAATLETKTIHLQNKVTEILLPDNTSRILLDADAHLLYEGKSAVQLN
ncbi:M1 family metallopeptidase [Flavisolibacter ginsenosidimutans]